MWSEGPEPQADLVRSLIQLSKSWRQTVCRSWHFLTDMREARYEWGMDAFSNSGARLLRKFWCISQETKNLPVRGVLSSYFVSIVTVFVLMDSLRYPSCSAVAGATINSIFFEAPFSNTSGNEVSFS
jgi:hypothetical protein